MSKKISDHLSQISTKWTKMEELMEGQGPEALAEFLASLYYDALAVKLQRRCSKLSGIEAFEVASDILYEFIKNDYRLVKSLDRDRGHLRGLFNKIVRSKLHKRQNRREEELMGESEGEDLEPWVDLSLDLGRALLELKKREPWFYEPFYLHFIEGRTAKEIAKILDLDFGVVRYRIYAARDLMKEILEDYRE